MQILSCPSRSRPGGSSSTTSDRDREIEGVDGDRWEPDLVRRRRLRVAWSGSDRDEAGDAIELHPVRAVRGRVLDRDQYAGPGDRHGHVGSPGRDPFALEPTARRGYAE